MQSTNISSLPTTPPIKEPKTLNTTATIDSGNVLINDPDLRQSLRPPHIK